VKKNCLVRVSGDLVDVQDMDTSLLSHLYELTHKKKYHMVVSVGGGTQINKAFKKAGLEVGFFGPFGRETGSLKERQLARDILEVNQAKMQDLLQNDNIPAEVVIPVIMCGSVLCHVNGDQYVYSVYNGFDVIYVATKASRVAKKKEQFKDYPKIKVIGF